MRNLLIATKGERVMGMDYEQFYRGWAYLIAQPWGQRYQERTGMIEEQRMTIRIQQELYFKRTAHCNPYLWEGICESYAAGDHWPSLDELTRSIRDNSPQPKPEELIHPDWSLAPEPLALVMAYHKRESVSIAEATLKILPTWMTTHADHPDLPDAKAFLSSAQGQFGKA